MKIDPPSFNFGDSPVLHQWKMKEINADFGWAKSRVDIALFESKVMIIANFSGWSKIDQQNSGKNLDGAGCSLRIAV